jgi:hypothetical protein
MKTKFGLFLSIVLLMAIVVGVAPAQTFGVNPYMRVVGITFKIDSVITSNDSTNVIYLPFKAQFLGMTMTATTVTDTVVVALGKTNPVTLVNTASIASATLLTAKVVAYSAAASYGTTMPAGSYWKVIGKVGTDAGNVGRNIRGTVWVSPN